MIFRRSIWFLPLVIGLAAASCAPKPRALVIPESMAGGARTWVKPPTTASGSLSTTAASPQIAAATTKPADIPQPTTVASTPAENSSQRAGWKKLFSQKPAAAKPAPATQSAAPEAGVARAESFGSKFKGMFAKKPTRAVIIPPSMSGELQAKKEAKAEAELQKPGGLRALFAPKPKVRKDSAKPLAGASRVSRPAMLPQPEKLPAPPPKLPNRPRSGGGLRTPDMLTMPEDNELRHAAEGENGGGGVTTRPPGAR